MLPTVVKKKNTIVSPSPSVMAADLHVAHFMLSPSLLSLLETLDLFIVHSLFLGEVFGDVGQHCLNRNAASSHAIGVVILLLKVSFVVSAFALFHLPKPIHH